METGCVNSALHGLVDQPTYRKFAGFFLQDICYTLINVPGNKNLQMTFFWVFVVHSLLQCFLAEKYLKKMQITFSLFFVQERDTIANPIKLFAKKKSFIGSVTVGVNPTNVFFLVFLMLS